MLRLSLAAALLSATLPATPREPAAPAVVLVSGGSRFGAGIVWDASEGLVLTALHVVELMPEIRVTVEGEPERAARVVERDPMLDLVLLRTDGPLGRARPVERPVAAPRAGDPVRWVGYPGRRAAAAQGTILDGARRFAGSRYLEIAGQADPGASGGPVLDSRGAIVGIVDLAIPHRGVTLAIPIEVARGRFPERAATPSAGSSQTRSRRGREARRRPRVRARAGSRSCC